MLNRNKNGCTFIVTKKSNNLVYGRICNDVVDDNSDNKCKKHLNCNFEGEYLKTDMLCKHIITQNSRGKDRKGMLCNEFTFDSINKNYCKKHVNQHPEKVNTENTIIRSFKVRCYPSKEQIKKLDKFFGDVRFTYNKCVEEGANDNFEKIRNKYVTNYKKKYEFLERTPKAIREFAVKEYITNMNNIKKKNERFLKKEKWKAENMKNYKEKKLRIHLSNIKERKQTKA